MSAGLVLLQQARSLKPPSGVSAMYVLNYMRFGKVRRSFGKTLSSAEGRIGPTEISAQYLLNSGRIHPFVIR